ncbi:hypothetical protein C0J52_28266, partial [Blattella germanica]
WHRFWRVCEFFLNFCLPFLGCRGFQHRRERFDLEFRVWSTPFIRGRMRETTSFGVHQM